MGTFKGYYVQEVGEFVMSHVLRVESIHIFIIIDRIFLKDTDDYTQTLIQKYPEKVSYESLYHEQQDIIPYKTVS